MHFAVEAMRPDGTVVAERLVAADRAAAVETLREKGWIVMRLEEVAQPRTVLPGSLPLRSGKPSARDLILFTRQMKMLLEAGAPLVPALEAAGNQTSKPAMRALLARLRSAVEEGDSLAAALEAEGAAFDPVFRSMIAAGEATASLPDVFGRLSHLAQQQLQVRKMIIAALVYPAVLVVLLIGVMCVLLFFVVPRFSVLFSNLRSPMPASTRFLFDLSAWLKNGWPYVLAGAFALVAAGVIAWCLPGTRARLDALTLRLPVIGKLAARLILARVIRVWAAMLRCHVPLLEAIRQSRDAVSNVAFLNMIAQVEETVSSGGRMAQAIAATNLADPIIVSALRTGEENGRLVEAVDFVSSWMDDDNTSAVQSLTRLAEPLLLALMGVVVGFVAMSLFLPLFDLAMAG